MLGRGGGVAMIPAPETRYPPTENAGRLFRYGMMIGKKKRLYYGAVVSNRQRGDCRPLPTESEVARMINLPQAAVLPKRAIQTFAMGHGIPSSTSGSVPARGYAKLVSNLAMISANLAVDSSRVGGLDVSYYMAPTPQATRNFISCNKEKSSHICHACQLGKHVNLPFVSSDTRVSSCFDIIHSDIWTSPIFETHANITLSDGLDPLVIGRTIQKAYETGMLENGDVVLLAGSSWGLQKPRDGTATGQSSQHPQHQEPITTTHSLTHVVPSHAATSPTPSSSTTSAQHPPTRTHPMVTRAQVGTVKRNPRFNLHTTHISPLPKSPSIALSDPNWRVVSNTTGATSFLYTEQMCKPALATALFSTIAFVLGAITSIVSGFLGMKIATYANARTTLEARKGVGKAFDERFKGLLYYGSDWEGPFEAITGYGLGGSSMALFGGVVGGIYTKAADVGADLVGKVIADNVGDNVGDIAGMGSDLFGSYAESSCAALVLCRNPRVPDNHPLCNRFLMTVGVAIVSFIGLPTSFTIFNFGVQKVVYNCPVQDVADSCRTGAATNVIFGLALGYKSVIIPIFAIAISIFVSFSFAAMYGIAVAALGMLSTIATGLAIDAYGPISDNAGGIAEMAGMSHRIRERTDALDAAGNTTAAIGKGFAIGSAALVSLALFGAFVSRAVIQTVDVLTPKVFIGLIVGAMLPFWFSAMTMKSVGRAALKMVEEVRRQFNTIPGLMEGLAKPDYTTCVKISTDASIKEMIPPGALVMLTPLIVGTFFGVETLSGVLAGALVSGVQVAISASNTGGAWDNAKKYIEAGASEHARTLGPKGTEPHKAAVIGDTIGDPLKDTSGPSLNILIKLMAVESLVFAPFFTAHGGLLFKL
ncbi:pyrophosphate-energized vacuolar membrane proton pump-like protein [Tanacetum coccineum]